MRRVSSLLRSNRRLAGAVGENGKARLQGPGRIRILGRAVASLLAETSGPALGGSRGRGLTPRDECSHLSGKFA